MRTNFTMCAIITSRTYALIAKIIVNSLACASIHARITLTCLTNITSSACKSRWTYATKTTVFLDAIALIHARLRSTRIILYTKKKDKNLKTFNSMHFSQS